MFLFPFFFFSKFYFIHPWSVSISLFFTFQFSIIRTIVWIVNLTCLYLFIVWLSTFGNLSWLHVHMCLCFYLCIIYLQICLCPFLEIPAYYLKWLMVVIIICRATLWQHPKFQRCRCFAAYRNWKKWIHWYHEQVQI